MKERLKKLGRILLQAIMWVFILSIRVDGKTLYQYGHGFFVDNRIVAAVDHQLGEMWNRSVKTVKYTFKTMSGYDDRSS